MAKVLMVDDEPDMQVLVRQKFKKTLKEGQFDLFFAESGTEALDILKRQTIDVLVTDVNMPGMDGLTLLEKAQSHSPKTRAIIVSAYGDMETLRKAMNRGAFDFVTKPVDFKQLENAITQSLRIKKCPLVHKAADQLSSYQGHLKEVLPNPENLRLTLQFPKEETSWLANAWLLDPDHLGVLLIHATSAQLLEPLAVILAEQAFHTHASTNPHTSLNAYLDSLDTSFATHVCCGVLQMKTLTWGFAQQGNFEVIHATSQNQHTISPDQTALLGVGDSVHMASDEGSSVRIEISR